MQIKFLHRPEIVSFSAFQELFCPRSLSLPSVLSLLTPTEFRLDVRCFPSDLRPPTSPSTTITSTSMSMNGPGNLCFVIRSSFGLRQFFSPLTSHFSSLSSRQLERVGQSLLPTHRAPFLLRLFGCSRSASFARGTQISLGTLHPKRN